MYAHSEIKSKGRWLSLALRAEWKKTEGTDWSSVNTGPKEGKKETLFDLFFLLTIRRNIPGNGGRKARPFGKGMNRGIALTQRPQLSSPPLGRPRARSHAGGLLNSPPTTNQYHWKEKQRFNNNCPLLPKWVNELRGAYLILKFFI